MKHYSIYFICALLFTAVFTGCINYKKLLTDEVVLKDGNSQTGTILQCDSTNLKIEKIDESISIIPWTTIDTVQGKKLKTVFVGMNLGYYNTPYFSVFRNEPFVGQALGMQFKVGLALRGNKLFYTHLTYSPAKPYSISKFGFGYQKYIGKNTYLKKNSFFWGSEFNFMSVKYNNGTQTTLEPYSGFERKINERIRLHFKFGLQFNIANKNNQTGVNFTIGVHFLKKDFKKQYETLNKEHKMYRN